MPKYLGIFEAHAPPPVPVGAVLGYGASGVLASSGLPWLPIVCSSTVFASAKGALSTEQLACRLGQRVAEGDFIVVRSLSGRPRTESREGARPRASCRLQTPPHPEHALQRPASPRL